jgi:ribosomal protein S18 acetylase RimI-like enzyme
MPVTIRKAERRDAAACTRVARAAKASWGYPEAWLREWEPQLTITEEYVRRHTVFVAEAGAEVIGMASLEETPERAEIGHLWVLPKAQGVGIGLELFTTIVELARAHGRNEISVESDPNARAFYERLGAVWVRDVPAPVGGVERHLPLLVIKC